MTDDVRDLSEINVTPLVDVMLVLLVIFIVTVPVLRMSVSVDLPQLAANPIEESTHRMEIALKTDGSYWLDGKQLDAKTLETVLRSAASNPKTVAEINADKECRYGMVMDLLGLVRESGIHKVGFATRR